MQRTQNNKDKRRQVIGTNHQAMPERNAAQIKALAENKEYRNERIGRRMITKNCFEKIKYTIVQYGSRNRHRHDGMSQCLKLEHQRKDEQYNDGIWTVGPKQVQHGG